MYGSRDSPSRRFSITLPDPLPTNYVRTTALDYNRMGTNGAALSVPAMIWSPIAQVPTNSFSQVIRLQRSRLAAPVC